MALYAFDGTWNTDRPGADRDTNVIWFKTAYDGPAFYREGVGTRFGALGHVIGGMTGGGGRTRIEEALTQLQLNLDGDDAIIDVVGFSRGAALALHFCNQVERMKLGLAVRFLGLWDCVPSFGVASIDLNIGWDLDLADNVEKCYHALALDERRETFHLHRLSARVESSDQPGRLFETWFRGVHSDVGGGNANGALSSIPLNWMFAKAASCGLPLLDPTVETSRKRMNKAAPISKGAGYDLIKNKYRTVRWNDDVHCSVDFRPDGNNPPIGARLVDDDGRAVGTFKAP
jgi:uncharacterized protein (DUF2235 family)